MPVLATGIIQPRGSLWSRVMTLRREGTAGIPRTG